MKRILLLLLPLLFVHPAYSAEDSKIVSERLIKEAKSAYNKALKANNAWRDTNKIIKKAQKAHKNMMYEKSISLAKQALNEGKMALEQYERQKDNYRFLDR